MSIRTEQVNIPVSGGASMKGYLARPDSGEALPAIIVYMEIFGVNSHIREVTERVAAEGFVALAPDYFHRTAPGVELAYDDAGMNEGMTYLFQLKADEMISDAEDTISFLKSRSDVRGDRIGATGFCIGGHMTYLTACETDIQAAASYYGGGIAAPQGPGGGASTVSRTPGIKGKIVCHFGGKDAMIPSDQVDAVVDALTQAGTEFEVCIYDEADHGFNCDQRDSYHAESAKVAWGRTFDLFNSTLKRR
jgi:carboxymethylenebutenolidase